MGSGTAQSPLARKQHLTRDVESPIDLVELRRMRDTRWVGTSSQRPPVESSANEQRSYSAALATRRPRLLELISMDTSRRTPCNTHPPPLWDTSSVSK